MNVQVGSWFPDNQRMISECKAECRCAACARMLEMHSARRRQSSHLWDQGMVSPAMVGVNVLYYFHTAIVRLLGYIILL